MIWDPIAIYGAVLSTVLAIWKFLTRRVRLGVTIIPDTLAQPPGQNFQQPFLEIKVANAGGRTLTLSAFGFKMYRSKWEKRTSRWLRRPPKNINAIFVYQPLPAVLAPGGTWTAYAENEQASHIIERATKGLLCCKVDHSLSQEPTYWSVTLRNDNVSP